MFEPWTSRRTHNGKRKKQNKIAIKRERERGDSVRGSIQRKKYAPRLTFPWYHLEAAKVIKSYQIPRPIGKKTCHKLISPHAPIGNSKPPRIKSHVWQTLAARHCTPSFKYPARPVSSSKWRNWFRPNRHAKIAPLENSDQRWRLLPATDRSNRDTGRRERGRSHLRLPSWVTSG